MKNFMLCLVCFLPASLLAQEWKTFDRSDIKFTAKYPADWVNKIKEGNRVFFTSPLEDAADAFAQNINISVTTRPQYGTTLKIKDIVDGVNQELTKSFSEFTIESEKYMKWNGLDAFEITYTGRPRSDESMEVRIVQRLCFYKTRLYLVTYTALKEGDVYAATARQIINTIKFKP